MTNLIVAFCKFANTLEKKNGKTPGCGKTWKFFSPNDEPSASHKFSAP
jgi:hypothetical protein